MISKDDWRDEIQKRYAELERLAREAQRRSEIEEAYRREYFAQKKAWEDYMLYGKPSPYRVHDEAGPVSLPTPPPDRERCPLTEEEDAVAKRLIESAL